MGNKKAEADDITAISPAAYIFGNGNVMYFDEDGQQVNEYQQEGMTAIHEFLEEYPDADAWFANWDSGVISAAYPLSERFIDNIKEDDHDAEE